MFTAKSVINLGLGKIAASRVVTLEPPKSSVERHCAEGWPVWRDSELMKRDWFFATKNALLTLSPTTEADALDGLIYRYATPNDMLRPIRNKQTRWQQRGLYIYSSEPTLTIPYIARVSENEWTGLFADVVACRVAMDSTEFATQSNTKGERADVKYAKAVSEAARANMFVQGPVDIRTTDDDEWIAARIYPGVTE